MAASRATVRLGARFWRTVAAQIAAGTAEDLTWRPNSFSVDSVRRMLDVHFAIRHEEVSDYRVRAAK